MKIGEIILVCLLTCLLTCLMLWRIFKLEKAVRKLKNRADAQVLLTHIPGSSHPPFPSSDFLIPWLVVIDNQAAAYKLIDFVTDSMGDRLSHERMRKLVRLLSEDRDDIDLKQWIEWTDQHERIEP